MIDNPQTTFHPIATLPKDGTKFILAQDNSEGQLVLIGGHWVCADNGTILSVKADEDGNDGFVHEPLPDYYQPTHWWKA